MAVSKVVLVAGVYVIGAFAAAPASAQAFLNYSSPPADSPRSAFIGQVTNYPKFRPVQRQPVQRTPQPAPTRTPEPSAPGSDNVILRVGDTIQVVPRARISDN